MHEWMNPNVSTYFWDLYTFTQQTTWLFNWKESWKLNYEVECIPWVKKVFQWINLCVPMHKWVHSPQECLVWDVWLDQNFGPSLLTNKLWLIFMGKKQKKFFFWKKNSKWPTQKKCIFQNRQFSKFFCENFTDGSLG